MRFLHCRSNQITRWRTASRAALALVLAAGTTPANLQSASTGTASLYMPQGAAAGTANGDYITATGGLNTYYSYFVEVPPGLTRLVVELFDADVGDGAGEDDAQRDRQRGAAFNSAFQYALIDPSGATVATANDGDGTDNTWFALYDVSGPISSAPTFEDVTTVLKPDNGSTTITLTAPATVNVNDLLIAVVSQGDTSGTLTAAAGWTTLNLGDCGGGGGNESCQVGVYYRVAAGDEDGVSYNFTIGTDADEAVGSILRYSGVDPSQPFNPAAATTNTGTDITAEANAITTSVPNVRVLRVYTAADNPSTTQPGGTSPRVDLSQEEADDTPSGVVLRIVDAAQAAAGSSGALTSTLGTAEAWRTLTFGLRGTPSSGSIANGHWEIRIDTDSGDDINGLGIRAHDGTSGSGGTELPIYYDSHTQFGVNPVSNPTSKDYDLFPWITNGCQGVVSTFDFDANNTGNQGSVALTSPVSIPGGTSYTQTIADGALSANDVWARNTFGPWTNDVRSTRYGIWRADVNIQTYFTGGNLNGNYSNMYLAPSTQPADPPTQPFPGVFRVYLPTDVSATTAPVKPYIEQLLTWVSGPEPPDTGQQTIYNVTIRVVNPTTQAITFSTPNNVVTANVPGSGATFGGNAGVSQGTITSQPALGGTGNVVWNPGTVPAGNGDATIDNAEVQLLTYYVRVTPTSNNQRVVVTGTPASNGTRAQYVDETGNTSQARATYLQGPLCELAITENAPTRAIVTGLSTESTRDGVVVAWTTATEDGTVGYRLYREQEGEWVAVGDLVRADPRAVGGASYRVLDPGADPSGINRYGLVEVDRLGRNRVLGPFDSRVESAGADAPENGQEVRAAAPPAGELERLAHAAARASDLARVEDARSRPIGVGSSAPLKIRIRESGLYALSSTAVAAASGLSEPAVRTAFRSNQVRVEQGGGAVAALAASDGSALYFYGEARDSIYGLDNVYWLRFAAGVKMGKVALAPWAIGGDSPTASLERIRVEQELFEATVLPIAPDEDYWFWDVLSAGVPGVDTGTYPVSLPAAYSGGADGSVEVRLRGASETGVTGEHQIDVRYGATLLGTVAFDGLAEGVASFPLPASLLGREVPEIELFSRLEGGVPYSDVFVDGFDVTYSRRHEASADRLELTADTSTVNGVGFTAADVTVFDVTDRRQPKLVSGPFGRGGLSGFAVGFRAQPGHRYLLTRLAAARTPLGLEADVASDLHGATGAQYVAIAPPGLVAAAGQLAALRAGQGLSTLVVSLADIDDEFGFGLSSPENLRAFLAWAYSHWSVPPVYVALVGEGTYDYRDLTGLGGNLIPALMVNAGDGLYASDSRYGDVDGDGLPEMAVGRIPVLTPAELATYVDRLTQVENASADALWRRNAILASDDADPGAVDFTEQSEAAGERLPASFDRLTVHLAELDEVTAHGQLLADLQTGGSVFLFHGHGGLDRLADESMLAVSDVDAIQNQGREPFFAALTCAINRFEIPGYPALGEEMTRASDGAAIAVWAPSGISLGSEAVLLGEHLADSVFRAPVGRLGDAVLEAERRFADSGGSTEMLQLYHLLGDPALRLVAPVIEAPGGGGSPSVE